MGGKKPQIHPTNLTKSALGMWWKELGEFVWRRVRRVGLQCILFIGQLLDSDAEMRIRHAHVQTMLVAGL
jgi:hypothetical protein